MPLLGEGNIAKMHTQHNEVVTYELPIGDSKVPMNELIGKSLQIIYGGQINCNHCGRKTKKSFSQGYCYPCFQRLAQCDTCIMSPEKCHYAAGTCREPSWGEEFCMQDHFIYLANSSGLKVGITRGTQIPTRWMDQGAVQALPILRVKQRLHSGLVEVIIKQYTKDKTDWRAMLKGKAEMIDMHQAWRELWFQAGEEIEMLRDELGLAAIADVESEALSFEYPVEVYPEKVKSFNLDKAPIVEGMLQGIKGQYLIFDTGVINLRKYTGYNLSLATV